MKKVAVVTDSNAGIRQKEAKELGIFVLPMPFTIDDQTYYEDINLTHEEFFEKQLNGAEIFTSQPVVGNVKELWDQILKDYDEENDLCDNPYIQKTQWGWPIDAKGLRYTLNWLYDRYQLPMFIVENAFGAYDKLENGIINDDYRIDYFKGHIHAMKESIEDGVPLIGYTTWGPIDLVSAGTGQYAKRYGFIYVDRHDDGTGDFSRSKKDSFYWYKKVCESNGEEI